MLVLPTQPRGGSVIFSFSNKSCTAWATTATASLMWADSFFPLMSCKPITPATSREEEAGQQGTLAAPALLPCAGLGGQQARGYGAKEPSDAVGKLPELQVGHAAVAVLGWNCPACWMGTGDSYVDC